MTRRSWLGRTGEEIAAAHLKNRGLVLLARNWRPTGGELRGELDLVGRAGGALVICEVKARLGADTETTLLAVTPRKQHRLRLLARRFIQETGVRPECVRFDVVAVRWAQRDAPAEVVHVEGAF